MPHPCHIKGLLEVYMKKSDFDSDLQLWVETGNTQTVPGHHGSADKGEWLTPSELKEKYPTANYVIHGIFRDDKFKGKYYVTYHTSDSKVAATRLKYCERKWPHVSFGILELPRTQESKLMDAFCM